MTLKVCVQKTILFGIGGVFLTVGVIMASMWPFLFGHMLKSQLALTQGSKTYSMWVETPLPMFMDIYLFNWTNSDDITAKPILQQVGPYVFSEKHFKVNTEWDKNTSSIKYQQYRKWIYRPDLSNGSLSDTVTNLNVLAVTVGALCKNLGHLEKLAINEMLKMKEPLVVTRTVSQLLFEGYSDPVLEIMKIMKKYHVNVPVDFDKFGWFYGRNMSEKADGVFLMDTGEKDIEKVGNVVEWNGRTVEPFYSGSCSKVEGSLGELWPPSSASQRSVNLYAFDICGSLPLKSSGMLSLHSLSGTKFCGCENVFDNGTLHSENDCYCKNKTNCPASGVRDVSSCRGGAPVFVSFPHFYMADPSYGAAVEGLSPDPLKHTFSISLEESTGVVLQVSARLQINLLTEEIQHMSYFKVPHTYMPMIWFDQHAEITESMAHTVRPLSLLASYGVWVLIGVALIGIILVLTGVFLTLNNCFGTPHGLSQSESLLTEDN